MRPRRPLLALVVAAMAAASLALVPSAAAADDGGSVVLPPTRYTASACAGKAPIVVASDAAAQSDLYSAVTLAGVVDTDCIVLAGARSDSWPSDQRARLDAAEADGYVVGGLAAVPGAKVSGLRLKRLAGADRWETARLVGNEARSLAGGEAGDAEASVGAEDPATDCTGDVPIVVASDAAAQSDLYSAVTLAGVIGTDCIVLAGDRSESMLAAQRSRLDSAAAGGYVVGGIAAVPAVKVAGRGMTRLAGTDRWQTAELVGAHVGMPKPARADQQDSFAEVSVGHDHLCAIRTDNTLACWGSNRFGKSEPPDGEFIDVSVAEGYACAVSVSRDLKCWGSYLEIRPLRSSRSATWFPSPEPPAGKFTEVVAARTAICALSTQRDIVCSVPDFGNRVVRSVSMSGDFSSVSVGGYFSRQVCGVTTAGLVRCWAIGADGEAEVAFQTRSDERFLQVDVGRERTCGLKLDRSIVCWSNTEVTGGAPRGTEVEGDFSDFSVGDSGYVCGLDGDGALACPLESAPSLLYSASPFEALVGDIRRQISEPPAGRYMSVSASAEYACAVSVDHQLTCWGRNVSWPASAHGSRFFPSSQPGGYVDVLVTSGQACGLRTDGAILCWGGYVKQNTDITLSPANPSRGTSGYGVRYLQRQAAPGSGGASGPDGLAEQYVSLSAADSPWMCALPADGSPSCWSVVNLSPLEFTAAGSRENQARRKWKPAPDAMELQTIDINGIQPSIVTNGVDGPTICGISLKGSLVCWGSNFANQAEPPDGIFKSVSLGRTHGCAIRGDDAVVCWGGEYDKSRPALEGRFRSAYSSNREDGLCALRIDGRVVCRGAGTTHPQGSDRWAHPALTGQELATVDEYCGLQPSGRVSCWGVALVHEYPSDTRFAAVSSSTLYACGVSTSQGLVCWGRGTLFSSHPPYPGRHHALGNRCEDYALLGASGHLLDCFVDTSVSRSFVSTFRSSAERCWILLSFGTDFAYNASLDSGYEFPGTTDLSGFCGRDATELFLSEGIAPPPREFLEARVTR